jgi:hypothetical protein
MAKRRGHGEGSIYQLPDGRWRAAVSLGWRETKDGQPIWRRKIVIGKTRYEVQDELKKLLRDRPIAADGACDCRKWPQPH